MTLSPPVTREKGEQRENPIYRLNPATPLSEFALWDPVLRSNLTPHLETLRNGEVLEIGCGRGMLARQLTSLGANVVGLDLRPSSDWYSRRDALAPRYVVGRGERLPFRDDSFDAVISCSSLQYQDHRETFAELIRVTRHGGMLLLHENMPHNPFVLVFRWLRKRRATQDSRIAEYLAGIRCYLSPTIVKSVLPFPELQLTGHKHFYFLSPLTSMSGGARFRPGIMRLDDFLFRVMPFLRRYSWHCAYRIEVHKNVTEIIGRRPTIGKALKRFAETRKPRYLFQALIAIVRQGRIGETLYGVFCLATRRPATVNAIQDLRSVIKSCLITAEAIMARNRSTAQQLSAIVGLPPTLVRPELIVRTSCGYVVGEYSVVGRSARLFHVVDGVAHASSYYDRCTGVRHLHSIAPVGDDRLLVSTGDSSKYLDEWHIRQGRLVFVRRLMKRLAGFTAYACVGSAIYFGTDFSERPNYLFRLQDRRKFFLPLPAFRQFVVSMVAHEDRYLVCRCRSLSGAASLAIFDVQAECFVHCAPA
jgi:SAM-dependent methyltransferase